jgi:Zn-dependent peptidase ImmA (M78 family)/DNA-binding XRE family transcriptional regulator
MEASREHFCAERLRIARVFNGMSQRELGAAVGVAHQFINAMETGRKRPNEILAVALGNALGFEPRFFYGSALVQFKDNECHFRRRKTTLISTRAQVLAYGTLFGQFFSFAREHEIIPPHDNFPTLKANSKDEIEKAAEHCRTLWELGLDVPITNMARVVEGAGAPIAAFDGAAIKVDAFSRVGNPNFVVINKKAASRCRFDLGHECGHLVLHRGTITGTPESEAQADAFAAALLLPRQALYREFPRNTHLGIWERLFQLKTRWRVSLGALIRRAAELGLIDRISHQRLYRELSARGWIKSEPHEFDHEQPEIVPLVLKEFERSYKMERSDVARGLGWKPQTFLRVTGLPVAEAAARKKWNVISIQRKAPQRTCDA